MSEFIEKLQQIPEWLQYISLFLSSMLKSYTGSIASAVFNHNYFEMLLINFSAVIVSILLTYQFRKQLLSLFQKRSKSKNGYSKKLKKAMIWWKNYGIYGIAVISPVLISIPIGVIVSAHFKTSKKMILTTISISAFIWINIFYFIAKFGLLELT